MIAEIINIGSELTTGRIVNSNASYLAKHLNALGLDLGFITVTSDEPQLMIDALKTGLKRAELLLITGGLGPTSDDITTEVITSFLKQPLVRNETATIQLLEWVKRRRRVLTLDVLKMANLPHGAQLLANHNGMAAGYYIRYKKSHILVFPGVPDELQMMFEKEALPIISEKILPKTGRKNYSVRILKLVGLPEAQIGQAVKDLRLPELSERFKGEFNVGYQTDIREVKVILEIRSKRPVKEAVAALDQAEALVRQRLGKAVVTADDKTLPLVVHEILLQQKKTLALAESCTGGLLAAALTDFPGSSNYFLGGVVCYSNTSKTRDLGVPPEILQAHGAVSEETAAALARGVKARFNSNIGLSITGIAGPDGGSETKPVGTVHFAIAQGDKIENLTRRFRGTRTQVRAVAVVTALNLLRLHLS